MTKRILSFVIVLAMLVSVLPIHMVSAEQAAVQTAAVHDHSDAHKCSVQCAGGTITWTPWGVTNGSAGTFPTVSGHYYLECDLTLTARNDIPAGQDVTVCLNGWDITETGDGNVSYVSGNLTIADCTASYDADGNYVSGAITGCRFSDGGCFNVRRGGKLVLESGKLTNSSVTGGGGAVSLQAKNTTASGGAFYMYGGEITGCSAASGGGIVANNGGTVYIGGGRIDGNTDKNTGKAIYMVGADSRLTVTGSPYIDQVYFDNASNPGLTVSGLTMGAKVGVKTKTTSAALDAVFHVTGTQESWDCHWVTVNGKSVSRDGDTYKFGHFHGTQEYSARTGTGLPTGAVAGKMNYYYLAEDIIRLDAAALVELKNDVTICLNGFEIVHKNKANGIYNITGGALVLEDGWAHTDASGIYRAGGVTYGNTAASTAANGAVFSVNGGDFTLQEGIIHGFNGTSAPVYAVGGTVSVHGGEFRGNTATGTGAALYAKDGTAFTMTGGLFENNRSTANQAGALYLLRCTVNITGGTFRGNYAKKDAGSLYLHTSTGTMSGVEFKNNESATSGSGFGVSGAADMTISQVTVTGSKGGNGAIIIQGSAKVKLSDSRITGNDVYRGGGIYLVGTADLTLDNVEITGNTASIVGGGLYWDGATAKLTLSGKTAISDNSCKGVVSNLHMSNAAQLLTVKDLDAASRVGISNRTGYVSSEVAADCSASFFCDDGDNTVTLEDSRLFIGSSHRHCADGRTDCGHSQEGWTKWTATDSLPTDAGCYFLAQDVKLTGRWNVSQAVKLCLNGHTVTQTAEGQRIMNVTGSGAVVLTDCQETPGVLTGGTATADGGAIRVEGENASLTAYNITVTGNTTTGHGGAIFVYRSAKLELTNVTLSHNEAGSTGGAITAREGGQLTVTGCTVENNKSKADGGGIYAHSKSVTAVTDTVIRGNESKASAGGMGFGGSGATGTLTNVTLSGNKAPNGGGLIVQGSSLVTATGLTIENNTATYRGGAIYVVGGNTLTLADSTVTGNTATKEGGIYVAENGTVNILSTKITDNEALSGGGVYACSGAVVKLEGTPVIQGNKGGNLQLVTGDKLQIGTMADGASVAVSTGRGAFTESCADYTGYFTSDSAYQMVVYAEGALHMDTADEFYHKHCLCNSAADGCEHINQEWDVWDKTDSLPTSGSYYLLYDVVLTGEMSVSGDLKLCLNGHTVKAAENKRIFSTPKNAEISVSIADCTGNGKLTGGVDTAKATGGGAIFIRAKGTLNLYGGTITGNKSVTAAGAILLADYATFNMYGGVISENGARDAEKNIEGGAVYGMTNSQIHIHGGKIVNNAGSNGGGIYAGGRLTVTGGEISGNTASGQGGGVYGKIGDLVLSGGLIAHNTAVKDGGGLYYRQGNATISGGTVQGNSSSASGGGIAFSTGSQVTVTGGTVTGNTSPNGGGMIVQGGSALNMQGGRISGNTSTGRAGGIYQSGGTAVFSGGEISGNISQTDGGGLYIRDSAVAEICGNVLISGNKTVKGAGGGVCYTGRSTGKISGGVIEKNQAPNGGGMIVQGNVSVEITDVTVKNNTATNSGGGIYVNNSALKVSGGKVTGNAATKGQGGGMICAGTSEVTVTGGTFSYNTSYKDGAGIYNSKGILRLSGMTITGNQSEKGAGGGFGATKEGQVIMTGGSVTYNKAGNAAGVIIQSKAHLDMYGGTIAYNEGNQGAGLYVNNASANLQGGTILGNTSRKNGGGGYMYNSKITMGPNFTVKKNESTNQYCGGLYFNLGTLNISGSKFVENKSKMGGSGFYTFKTECNIKDVYVADNVTTNSTGGGVVLSRETKFVWEGGIIENNYSSAGGAGILIQNWAEGTATGLIVRNNIAGVGGGGLFTYTCVDANFVDCEIYGNKTSTSGAGVFLSSPRGSFDPLSYLNFTGCKIYDNESGEMGGGVYISKQIISTWTDCEIYNNTCGTEGGGMYTLVGSRTSLDNVRLTGNKSGKTGSGIYAGDNLKLKDVTVTGNRAQEGAAVYLPKSDFDGESYQFAYHAMSGDIIIADNQGTQGDLFIDAGTAVGTIDGGLGKNTKITVELAEGILTNTILAEYNYEGGDLHYTVTYGDRSTKEPEYEAANWEDVSTETSTTDKTEKNSDIWLYAGIGAVVLAIAVIAVLVLKKKKSKTPEANKE